ncbi:hypothetical protein GH733_004601 [Mirounga leonina]|nr:hypothetical protein GH733_004813 [Mirounga leonina]KAF3828695.1 hypothetical protein GH733_004601 [Mirounga leonina]
MLATVCSKWNGVGSYFGGQVLTGMQNTQGERKAFSSPSRNPILAPAFICAAFYGFCSPPTVRCEFGSSRNVVCLGDEVKICLQCFIKIDGKVRTDITYPAGFMDVISTDKIGENFHLIYDTKGHFAVHRITPEKAKCKLWKVRKIFVETKGIPHLVIHDACTIRCPDPLIQVSDTIQIDLETGKITDFIKFDTDRKLKISNINSSKIT